MSQMSRVFASESLRFYHACQHYSAFIAHCNRYILSFLEKGYPRWLLLTGFLQVFRKNKHKTGKYKNTPHNWFQDILFYIPERYQPHNDVDRRISPAVPTSSSPAPASAPPPPTPHAHDCPTGPTLTDNMDFADWVPASTATSHMHQPTSTAPRDSGFILRRYGPQGNGRRPAFPPHSPDRTTQAPRRTNPRRTAPATTSSPGRAPSPPKRARTIV